MACSSVVPLKTSDPGRSTAESDLMGAFLFLCLISSLLVAGDSSSLRSLPRRHLYRCGLPFVGHAITFL